MTPLSIALLAGGAFSAALLLTFAIRRAALRVGMLDEPNARSSHVRPVPRGGGLSIVLVVLGTQLLALPGLDLPTRLVWLLGGGLVALVGLIDDRRGLGALPRAAAHALAGLAVALWCHGMAHVPFAGGNADLGPAGYLIAVLCVVWSINFFNFMDGIDGIAGAQAVFVFAAGVACAWLSGSAYGVVPMAVLAAASAGFLCLNWAPARIFMGDAGSGFLGFAIATTALSQAAFGGVNAWTWLILDGLFAVDATVTLYARWRRGERLSQAHRSHAYQRLARRYGSHARVSAGFAVINIAWLLPLAAMSAVHPARGPWLAALALAPLIVAARRAGAGQAGDIEVSASS